MSPARHPTRRSLHTTAAGTTALLAAVAAAALAAAPGYSRAVAPELAPGVIATLQQRLMAPILAAQSSGDEAIRTTATAPDDLLRG